MLPAIQVLPTTPGERAYRQAIDLLILLVFAALSSIETTAAETPVNEDKPFAVEFILLQLSDADAAKQAAVLDVASNLVKHYGGPDMVDIQVIGFGPGIHLYERGNPLAPRIKSLLTTGVRFVVCKNTLDTLARTKAGAPELIDDLVYVQTGVAYIAEKVREGYILVRP